MPQTTINNAMLCTFAHWAATNAIIHTTSKIYSTVIVILRLPLLQIPPYSRRMLVILPRNFESDEPPLFANKY